MKKTVLLVSCWLLLGQFASAQLCTGSLGDPLVNITFGSNSAAPLRAGVTNLSYTTASCPNDGQYTITNATANCFGSTWYNIPSDHTGNSGGQFMLVNASVTPNDFYVDTVSGLCGNTTFEFAAWVLNILKPSACSGSGTKPNLTFRIETTTGTVLLKYDSGDIPFASQAQWNQYGTFFKTPPGVSTVVLRITNNAPGGCGNDLALDDITFRPCGPSISTSVRNQPSVNVATCANDTSSFILDASSSNGFAGSTIQWQVSIDAGNTWTDITGAQSTSFMRQPTTTAGVYQYRTVVAETANFSSVQCRVASSISTVTVYATPVFVPKLFVLGCTSSDVLLQTAQGTGYTYQWTGPNNFSSTIYNPVLPKVTYTDSGLYRASVKTADGCVAVDSFLVKVFPGVTAKVNASGFICEGGNYSLLASGGTVYNWSPVNSLSAANIANPTASPPDTTLYKVIVSNQYGCSDSAQTTINVLKNPVVSAGPDKKIFQGQSVVLEGSISGNLSSFFWLPASYLSNPNTLTPTASPTDTTTYTLYALPGMGCPAVSDKVFVQVFKKLVIPNAFSPNGDGINDTWVIQGLETYGNSTLSVYSRSGKLVFETKANSQVWDGTYNGKPLPLATYYYVIDLQIGGAPVSGWVVILR
jgi:gliding motility-associated-like protein